MPKSIDDLVALEIIRVLTVRLHMLWFYFVFHNCCPSWPCELMLSSQENTWANISYCLLVWSLEDTKFDPAMVHKQIPSEINSKCHLWFHLVDMTSRDRMVRIPHVRYIFHNNDILWNPNTKFSMKLTESPAWITSSSLFILVSAVLL